MSSNIRKYLLVTLIHVERVSHITPHFVVSRFRGLFNCQMIVVACERHKDSGLHYHVGVLNDTASRHSAARRVREAFSEFEGRGINVSFHRSWNTICSYIVKEDVAPYCWGTTVSEVKERARRQRSGKQSLDLVTRLRACKTWREVMSDDFLVRKCTTSYSSIWRTWNDLHNLSEVSVPLVERLREYLKLVDMEGLEKPYTSLELQDRQEAFDWLAKNLTSERKHRDPQLLILGPPRTGKTEFTRLLGKGLSVYRLPYRRDDFTGAKLTADLWVMDEFHAGRYSTDVLNSVLDGSPVQLDSKYGPLVEKDRNIPVLLLSNKPPRFIDKIDKEAFDTRVQKTEFNNYVDLRAERLLRTLLIVLEGYKSLPESSNLDSSGE